MLLKLNSTGEDVKTLQTKLGLNPDGIFGTGTQTAVKNWQSVNGLTPDGVVGDGTWGKMFPVTSNKLNTDKLKGVIPDSMILELIEESMKFGVTTNLRLSHFLSQCDHESNSFKTLTENLNYSADGLKKIFPSYFPGNLNESYAHQPIKIGSRVYANRMGNGDEASQEGFKYRGRSTIMTTGKQNYSDFSKFIGEDCVSNPDLLNTKYALTAGLFFFYRNNLWTICDKGPGIDTITAVTKRVNGGINGISQRIDKFNKYWNLLKN